MKRNFFRVGILGSLVLLGWIAVVCAQHSGTEATSSSNPPSNPLRGEPEHPSAGNLVPAADQNPPPVADSIPDASTLDLQPYNITPPAPSMMPHVPDEPISTAAEASAGDGPALQAPATFQRPVERYAPPAAQSNAKPNSRNNGNRNPTPLAASEKEEPAPFMPDPFVEPTALPSAKAAKRPVAKVLPPASGMRRVSAVEPIEENAAPYTLQPGNALTAYRSKQSRERRDRPAGREAA